MMDLPAQSYIMVAGSKATSSPTLNFHQRCSGVYVSPQQAECLQGKALKISCVSSCYRAALDPVEPVRCMVATCVAVHSRPEAFDPGAPHVPRICRPGGTASPPDLLDCQPTGARPLSSETSGLPSTSRPSGRD